MNHPAVKRSLAIGKAFSPKQLSVFDQCGVKQMWAWAIAQIKDEGKRSAIVNLIDSGLEPQEAISQIEQTPEVRRADGQTYEVRPPTDRTSKRSSRNTNSIMAKERRIKADFEARDKIRRAFTPEQLEILYVFGVGIVEAMTIGTIRDRRQRNAVVSLIAIGLPTEDAIAKVGEILERREA